MVSILFQDLAAAIKSVVCVQVFETKALCCLNYLFGRQIISQLILFLNLPANQLSHLQHVLKSAARAVTNTQKFHHTTPFLKSLHWHKIFGRIHYKILSTTCKCLLSDKPAYLRNLSTVQSTSTTRSSSVIILKRPHNPSSLKVSSRSFYHSASALWKTLPKEFRQYNSTHSKSQPLLFQLSPPQFHKKLKTHLFTASFPT
jgi:hypothetical protein